MAMQTKQMLAFLSLTAGISFGAVSEAALYDRGSGLIYDDVLNVTWLQDANYSKTSGYDADGLMNWNHANIWAENLIYAKYSDWRLARNSPVNGDSFDYGFSFFTLDGSKDTGMNITSPNSELSYMFYVNLGLKSPYNLNGDTQLSLFGIFANGTYNGTNYGSLNDTSIGSLGQTNLGLVNNLQAYSYWSGTDYEPNPYFAFSFYTFDGTQSIVNKPSQMYAWAVRDGDVATVPVPAAFWLFGSILLSWLSSGNYKKRIS